jgi:hypothetical protein
MRGIIRCKLHKMLIFFFVLFCTNVDIVQINSQMYYGLHFQFRRAMLHLYISLFCKFVCVILYKQISLIYIFNNTFSWEHKNVDVLSISNSFNYDYDSF